MFESTHRGNAISEFQILLNRQGDRTRECFGCTIKMTSSRIKGCTILIKRCLNWVNIVLSPASHGTTSLADRKSIASARASRSSCRKREGHANEFPTSGVVFPVPFSDRGVAFLRNSRNRLLLLSAFSCGSKRNPRLH